MKLYALTLSLLVGALPSLASPVVERSACPSLPYNIHLYNDTRLPDPFRFVDGQQVTNHADWQCRQAEVKELFQRYELGYKPPRPQHVSGSFSNDTLFINAGQGGKQISWNVSITYPENGTAPYPAIIALDGATIPIPAGVAVITLIDDEIALQNDVTSRGVGLFYELYGNGSDTTAGAMMAWAWAVSRIVDVLEMTPESKINVNKLGVTGCSRDGKGALVAGAFEERIALTLVIESGSGGSACWRLSDYEASVLDQFTQTSHEIVTENVWFSIAFDYYAMNRTDLLPFDHHMLAGLVAPRGLFVTDNTEFIWLGPWSNKGCMKSARFIYEALGVESNMGFYQSPPHDHCMFPTYQNADLFAFTDKFFFDKNTNTDIFEVTYHNQSFNVPYWDPWAARLPNLRH